MNRFLRFLFALLVAIGATGAELQPPVRRAMDCCPVGDEGPCPCGMPAPARGPQSCGSPAPAPVAPPVRAAAVVAEIAVAADTVVPEPLPWPAAWHLDHVALDEAQYQVEPIPVDTGPPLLASERSSRLRVFRI